MSLFGDLNSAAQALSTHSQGVALAGKNLANATNPAYARQRLILGDLGTVADDRSARRAWASRR